MEKNRKLQTPKKASNPHVELQNSKTKSQNSDSMSNLKRSQVLFDLGKDDLKKDEIKNYYIQQKQNINIWTYLFRNLNKAINQLYNMCEYQQNTAYPQGVQTTLEYAMQDFQKLMTRFQIQADFSKDQNKGLCWDVGLNQDTTNMDDLKDKIEDLEPVEQVDFSLLSQLVQQKHMTFDEAIVLLIRERSSIVDEHQNKPGGFYGSFISKISGFSGDKYGPQYQDGTQFQTPFQDDIGETLSQNENDFVRSKSLTSGPQQLQKLQNKLNFHCIQTYQEQEKQELEKQEFNKEDLYSELLQKMKRAETKRSQHENEKLQFIIKDKKRLEKIKSQNLKKKNQKMQQALNKQDQAEQRKLKNINYIKSKAKDEAAKASEIAFIMMLENNNKKLTLDEKLTDVKERKLQLEEALKQRQQEKRAKFEAVRGRKQEQEEEIQEKIQEQLKKQERAEEKRKSIQEHKKKTLNSRTLQIKQSLNQKKNFVKVYTKDNYKEIINSHLHKQKSKLDKQFERVNQKDRQSISTISNFSIQNSDSEEDLGLNKILSLNNSFEQVQDEEEEEELQIQKPRKIKFKKTKKSKKKARLEKSYLSISLPDNFYKQIITYNKKIKSKYIEHEPKNMEEEQKHNEDNEISQDQVKELDNESDVNKSQNKDNQSNRSLKRDSVKSKSSQKEIGDDMKQERISNIKQKCKKIKQKLNQNALTHEQASMLGRNTLQTTPNKKKLLKLFVELEKQIMPKIKDYEQVANALKEVQKILENRREADLIIIRQSRFVPIIIEVCKRIPTCHHKEINSLLSLIHIIINILTLYSGFSDNRNYMLVSNRVVVLADLLSWCLHRPTQFAYSLEFLPNLFYTLQIHLKHRLEIKFQNLKGDLIEYMFCSGLLFRLKQKFQSFQNGLDLSSQVPLALLKSVAFLETLLSGSIFDTHKKPIFAKVSVSDSILFVLQETELIGVVQLLVSLLLSEGSCGKIEHKVMPQTVLSLTMMLIKFLNNVSRLELSLLQNMSKINLDYMFHIFNYLLTYCNENYDQCDDVKDLTNELILLIGYFVLNNANNKEMMGRGEQTLVQKLTALPFSFFCDKFLIDVLFPTILAVVHQHPRNLQILQQEMSQDMIIQYLKQQIHMPPQSQQALITQRNKSLSQGSTSSSVQENFKKYSLLMRMDKEQWQSILNFIMDNQ